MLACGDNMAQVQVLRSLVEQRLKTAVDDILGLFEGVIEEYQGQLCRAEQENQRQRKLLEAVLNPRVLLYRAGETSASHLLTLNFKSTFISFLLSSL